MCQTFGLHVRYPRFLNATVQRFVGIRLYWLCGLTELFATMSPIVPQLTKWLKFEAVRGD